MQATALNCGACANSEESDNPMARKISAGKRVSPKRVAGKTLARKVSITKAAGRTTMATPNVDKMSLKELQELEAKVKKAIAGAREREKAEMKLKVESMLAGAGLSLNEIYGGRGATKGKTVAPKYMNPDNRSETWTGRGRKPRWLVAKLNKGSKIEEFAI